METVDLLVIAASAIGGVMIGGLLAIVFIFGVFIPIAEFLLGD